jgi:4-amino-4-deoxy-L-arabinose transferase-like glycosyltransferase
VGIYIKRALKIGIFLLGIYSLLSLLWLFSKRLVYPYEIDWIEGGMLTSVLQILDGHNLYVQPSITYVPFLYAPVFFYLAAFVAKIFGASLLALRLVSVIATLTSLALIVLIVFGETKSWFWGFVSASLFAGLYPQTRFWFDLARVDSVFVMFFLFFLFSLRRGNSLPWQIAAGIFASMTILTKQNGLTMCLPIIATYFLFDWRRRLALPITFALVFGSISLAFILSSDGWYTYYCYGLALSQPNNWISYTFLDFINGFILPYLSIAALLSLFVFPLWFSQKSKDKERLLLWLVIFASTIITSYVAKSNVGGVNNVVIPTFAVFALLFGICAAEVSKVLQVGSNRYRITAEICFCLLALFQLVQVIYNPLLYMPSFDSYQNGSRALKLVKKFDGNVYVPNSSISLMAGKRTFAHPSAIWDVLNSGGGSRGKDILESNLQQAVDARLFDAIFILPSFDYFPDLQKYYVLDHSKYFLVDDTWKEKANIYVLP